MNALTHLDAPTRPRNVIVTSTDPRAFAEVLFGGLESARSGLQAARAALARAEQDAARVTHRRTLVGDPGVAWTWGEEFYRREWPRVQERFALCRAEIARCEARIMELRD